LLLRPKVCFANISNFFQRLPKENAPIIFSNSKQITILEPRLVQHTNAENFIYFKILDSPCEFLILDFFLGKYNEFYIINYNST
jgi:hypothetical protein